MPEVNYQVEGIRVALEMERRGKNLYERAQMFTEDPALIELLKELVEDETKHYSQFSAMLQIFGVEPMSAEETALSAAKAADFFFPGGLMQAAMDGALRSPEAMLEEAMQAERDSISFYGQLLSHIKELEQQEIILRIIREEMNHLRTLTERKQMYAKEENA